MISVRQRKLLPIFQQSIHLGQERAMDKVAHAPALRLVLLRGRVESWSLLTRVASMTAFCASRAAEQLRYRANYKPPSLAPSNVGTIRHLHLLVRDHFGHGSADSRPLRGTCLLRLKGRNKVKLVRARLMLD